MDFENRLVTEKQPFVPFDDWLVKWFKDNGFRLRFRYYRFPTIWKTYDVMLDRDGNDWYATDWLIKEHGPAKRPFRYYRRAGSFQFTPWCKGGKTEVDIEVLDPISGEYEVVITGESRCSLDDNFVYRIGRKLALADAYYKMMEG